MKLSSQHNTFKLNMKHNNIERQLIFSSNFDSGNLGKVDQIQYNTVINYHQYLIYIPNDCAGTQNEGFAKSWFYFSVVGFPAKMTVKFYIRRIHMLASVVTFFLLEISLNILIIIDRCIAFKKGNGKELKNRLRLLLEKTKLNYVFNLPLILKILITLPLAILSLIYHYKLSKDLYYHLETLIFSPEGRAIHLMTISSHQGKIGREKYFDQHCFPQKGYQQRSIKYRPNKPVILVTARVHPGQTPCSWAMKGVIDFLLNSMDARAITLRKFFVFMIIPMLNPDGVYHGNYRMDIFNQNLNRYYRNPDCYKHPSIYAVKALTNHLAYQNRLLMYFDLHAHAGKKGCFIYGNSLDDFYLQVQNQLFARLLSMNCVNFEYESCNFSKKQMSSKDRFEQLTKQGCGRVVLHKCANLIFSYTVQCGFHTSMYLNQLSQVSNGHRKIKYLYFYSNGHLIDSAYQNIHSSIYNNPYYTIGHYENLGKCIMINILEIFQKNPYSRLPNSTYKTIHNLRKEVALQVAKIDNYKKDQLKWVHRSNNITETVNSIFYQHFEKNNVFNLKAKAPANLYIRNDRKEHISTMKQTKPQKLLLYRQLTKQPKNPLATSAKPKMVLPQMKKEQKQRKERYLFVRKNSLRRKQKKQGLCKNIIFKKIKTKYV